MAITPSNSLFSQKSIALLQSSKVGLSLTLEYIELDLNFESSSKYFKNLRSNYLIAMYCYKKIDRQLNCWMVDLATKIYVMGSLSLSCVGSISDHVLITVTWIYVIVTMYLTQKK